MKKTLLLFFISVFMILNAHGLEKGTGCLDSKYEVYSQDCKVKFEELSDREFHYYNQFNSYYVISNTDRTILTPSLTPTDNFKEIINSREWGYFGNPGWNYEVIESKSELLRKDSRICSIIGYKPVTGTIYKEAIVDCVYYPKNRGTDPHMTQIDQFTYQTDFYGDYDPETQELNVNLTSGNYWNTISEGGRIYVQMDDRFIFGMNFEGTDAADWSDYAATVSAYNSPVLVKSQLGSYAVNFSGTPYYTALPEPNKRYPQFSYLARRLYIDDGENEWYDIYSALGSNKYGLQFKVNDDPDVVAKWANPFLPLGQTQTMQSYNGRPKSTLGEVCYGFVQNNPDGYWYYNNTGSTNYSAWYDSSTGTHWLEWGSLGTSNIGRAWSNSNSLPDYMDAMIIYNGTLSEAEVAQLCNQKYMGFFENDGYFITEPMNISLGFNQINVSYNSTCNGLSCPSVQVRNFLVNDNNIVALWMEKDMRNLGSGGENLTPVTFPASGTWAWSNNTYSSNNGTSGSYLLSGGNPGFRLDLEPDESPLDIEQDITVCAWLNLTNSGQIIWGHQDGPEQGYKFQCNGGDGAWWTWLRNLTDTSWSYKLAGKDCDNGQWQFVCLGYNGTNHWGYRDGSYQEGDAATGTIGNWDGNRHVGIWLNGNLGMVLVSNETKSKEWMDSVYNLINLSWSGWSTEVSLGEGVSTKSFTHRNQSDYVQVRFNLFGSDTTTNVLEGITYKAFSADAAGCEADWVNTNFTKYKVTGCLPRNVTDHYWYQNWTDNGGCNADYNTTYTNSSFCDFCQPLLANTSVSDPTNRGCNITDEIIYSRNWTQITNNTASCFALTNNTQDRIGDIVFSYNYTNETTHSCNYCSINLEVDYTDWSSGGCFNDFLNLSRTVTSTDLNNATCCNVTGIGTDCYNSGATNITIENNNDNISCLDGRCYLDWDSSTTPSGTTTQDFIYASLNVYGTLEITNVSIFLYNETGLVEWFSSSSQYFYNFTSLNVSQYNINATCLDNESNTNQSTTRNITITFPSDFNGSTEWAKLDYSTYFQDHLSPDYTKGLCLIVFGKSWCLFNNSINEQIVDCSEVGACENVVYSTQIDTVSELNEKVSQELVAFNVRTDDNLCYWDDLSELVECKTPKTSFIPKEGNVTEDVLSWTSFVAIEESGRLKIRGR